MATSAEGLRKAINYMFNFCEKSKLKVTSSKTKVTIFSRRKVGISKFKFYCNGNELEIVHLGINHYGSFKLAMEQLRKQAS